jgi:hypothetical protein
MTKEGFPTEKKSHNSYLFDITILKYTFKERHLVFMWQ